MSIKIKLYHIKGVPFGCTGGINQVRPNTLSEPPFNRVASYVFTKGGYFPSGGFIFMSRGIELPKLWGFAVI
jgi:hypothetical protein